MQSSNKTKPSPPCPQCNKVFSSTSSLVKHQTIHDPDRQRKFRCLITACGGTFYRKGELKEHTEFNHSSTKNNQCNFCQAKFQSKQGLDQHIVSTHCQEKTYKCDKCPKRFSRQSGLSDHAFTHSDEKSFSCSICPNKFKTKRNLDQHTRRLHKERKSFNCSQCHKHFSLKGNLQQHVRAAHEPGGGSRFGCYFCENKFATRYQLENHFTIHTQEKPFFCTFPSCGYSASDRITLGRHRQRHHPSDDQPSPNFWTCYFCSKKINSSSHLVYHIGTHTKETPLYPCNLCDRLFKSKQNLRSHITYTHTKEKPFPCPECDQNFITNSRRLNHIAATHRNEKRFHCDLCSLSSYYKYVIIKHRLALH